MNHTVWLIIFLLKDVAATCNGTWQEFRGMCYYVSPNPASHAYADALHQCDTMEADLASVTSQEITDFIVNNMILQNGVGCGVGWDCNPDYEFWIGLTKNISGVNMWDNSSEFSKGWTWQVEGHRYEWQNWRDDEPAFDEGYARMRGDGSWGGTRFDKKYRYICEQETNNSEEPTNSTTTASLVNKPMPNTKTGMTTQSPTQSSSSGLSIFAYVGPAMGVAVAIVIVVVVIVLCRKRRAAKNTQNELYYNTRGDLNNHSANNPSKTVNIQADSGNQYAYDNQLPPVHNASPLANGPMYAEIDKGGQRISLQGPPTANKPVDNGRVSAMYAQPDLTAKRNRRNLNKTPDEDVTLVENSTYATTLPK